mgnify:CR=1 FL=1|jgi:hypothetical protein
MYLPSEPTPQSKPLYLPTGAGTPVDGKFGSTKMPIYILGLIGEIV